MSETGQIVVNKEPGRLFRVSWQAWGAALVLFAAAWMSTGYSVYVRNHALQIPLVEVLNNPALFANDPFVETLSGYATPFWRGVAFINKAFPLEPLLLILFIIEKACLLLAAGALGRALFPKSTMAPWAGAAVAAVGIPAILGSTGKITPPYLEQTGFSMPFFLWAFAALISGRRWRWALLAACGATLNIMYGVYFVIFSAAGIVFTDAKAWKRWAGPAVLLGVLALPTFLAATNASGAEAADKSVWLTAAAERFVSHLVPLRWSWHRFVVFAAFVMIITVCARRLREPEEKRRGRFMLGAAICGVFWLALAFVAMYVAREPRLLVLHPARGTDFLYATGAVFLAVYFARRMENGEAAIRPMNIFGLSAALVLLRALEMPKLLVIPVVFFVTALLGTVWRRRLSINMRQVTVGMVLVVLGIGAARQVKVYTRNGSFDLYRYGATAAERELAVWAKENSDIDAGFLVPSGMSLFRPLSQRPVFGTWKDGSAILWHRPFVEEWVQRMHTLGRPVIKEHARYRIAQSRYPTGWDDEMLREIGTKSSLGIGYAVLPTGHDTELPVVFQGIKGYKIVELPQ